MLDEKILKNEYEVNIKTINALNDAGSDLCKAHSVEHHFLCYDINDAKMVIDQGQLAGYETSKILDDVDEEGKKYYYFDLIKDIVPTIQAMNKESYIMLNMAKENNLLYDGWGANVVKS